MHDDSTILKMYFDGFEHSNAAKESAADLEARGWHEWLMTLCPFAFEEEFSADHVKFWDLYWSVLFRIREQRVYFKHGLVPTDPAEQEAFFRGKDIFISDDEYVILCVWGRGLGKSAAIEAAAMMRGCLLGGYCLYVCESDDQASEHIGNIKGLIDDPDSRVVEFYPHMQVDENAIFRGKKTKNRADLFMTSGGYICRAKGMNASLRGIRVGNLRPDSVVFDDLDSVNDSIAVSIKKLKQMSSSIIPTQARRHATILAGQNLIGETTVFSMIYTGQSDVLSARTTIGVSNTFERFEIDKEYVTFLDEETGLVRHKILPSAVPTWKGVDIAAAQKFLNDSGLETFLAEYMNSFAHLKTGKVFHEYNEERHLITWDMFQEKFGTRWIPGHWRAKAACDIGYSKESLSAWIWIASAAQNSPAGLAGRYFGYRSKTFEMESIDDQALNIWEDLFPDPTKGKRHFEATQDFGKYPELVRVLNTKERCSQLLQNFQYNADQNRFNLKPFDPLTPDAISDEDKALFYVKDAKRTFKSQIQSWTISHEKTGEQKTLAQKYGIPANKVRRFEADAGVAEANHLLRGDYTQPHPFYPDEIVAETGLYRLGSPFLFFICEQIKAPRDDRDWKIFREHVGNQRWTQEKLTDLGLSRTIPMKYRSDAADALRMWSTDYAMPDSTKLTMAEEVQKRVPEKYRPKPNEVVSREDQMSRQAALLYAEEQTKAALGLVDDDFSELEDEEDYYNG